MWLVLEWEETRIHRNPGRKQVDVAHQTHPEGGNLRGQRKPEILPEGLLDFMTHNHALWCPGSFPPPPHPPLAVGKLRLGGETEACWG